MSDENYTITEERDREGGCLCCGAPEVFECGCRVVAVTETCHPFLICFEHGQDLPEQGVSRYERAALDRAEERA